MDVPSLPVACQPEPSKRLATRTPLLALLAALVWASCAPAKQQPRTSAPRSIGELQQRIENVLRDTRTPGAGIAIVRRDGPEWIAGLGLADVGGRRPATPDTLFRIGSVSKAFVSLSVLKLQQEGRLSLDDTVRSKAPDVAFTNPWEATDPVRVVHLLEHTAGLDDLALCEYANNDPKPLSLAEGLAFHPASRIVRWRPGTRWSYSNSGPAVAAYVVEKVTGMRFEDYVAENWFRPLGMTTATYFLTPEVARSGATLYHDDGVRPFPYWHVITRPSGSINASAREMANYVQFYLNRGAFRGMALLPPEAIDRMEQPASSLAVRAGLNSGYGLSNGVVVQDGYVFHGHDGGVPGGLTKLLYMPDAGVGYVFMINSSNETAVAEVDKLVRAYITRGLTKPALPKPAPDLRTEMALTYSGWYEPVNPRNEILHYFERIAGLTRVNVEGSTVRLSPLLGEGRRFLAAGGSLFRRDDAPIPSLVLVGDRAEGTLVITHTATLRRIPTWTAWTELGIAGLAAIFAVTSVLFAVVWIPRKMLRRMRGVPRLRVRVLPLLSVLCAAAFVGILMAAADDYIFTRLGLFTPWSAAMFAATILFAVCCVWGLVEALRSRHAGVHSFVWWHSLLTSLFLTIVALYLTYWGVIGWRPWA